MSISPDTQLNLVMCHHMKHVKPSSLSNLSTNKGSSKDRETSLPFIVYCVQLFRYFAQIYILVAIMRQLSFQPASTYSDILL